jgi:two-component system cell cycle sensor histidine kinase/response regulator CckA
VRRVLIVDEHEDGGRRVRDYLTEVAAMRPEDVDHTASREDALRRLGTGAYDLCIVDDRAGSRDGASLLREARARGIDTPAVLVTAGAPPSSEVRYATVLNEAERRRYRAEDALLRSEERYRTLFDAVPVGLYRTASDRRIANANPAMAQMLGFASVEELIGSDAVELYVEPEARREWVRRLETEGLVQGFEAQLRRQDGSALWVLESARATLDDAGRILHIEGTVQDITERKEAELRLRGSEAQYRLLFDANPHPMWLIDRETLRFLAANEAAVRSYGFSREEFLSMTAADIRPPEEVPQMHAGMRAATTGGIPVASVGEVRHRRKDGTVFDVNVTSSPLTLGGQPAMLAMAVDVTDSKRAAAALEKLEGQLRQSQKMEAIGQLAGGVAHDFNNLLGVIIGYSELLLRDLATGSPAARRMTEIRNAAGRAAELTRQLLAFSRRQVLQPRVLDLNAVVSEAEAMLARVIGENVEIVTVLAPDLGRVRADPGQIQQVIFNFAVNARDAMPGGGRLTLRTRNVDLDHGYAERHPGLAPGRYVALLVSDTGHGMSPEVLEHMFEPFFTTKGQGHGTGLGLATVYGIVTQSGGHVEVESAVDRGTTFKVYLPLADAEQDDAAPASPPVLPRASETVLLIEDAEPLRDMVQEILEADGYRVLAAGDAERALEVAASHAGPIALVITDVVMPGMSGPAAAERLQVLRPEARVLFMSGYTDEAIGRQGVLDRETQFIQKPFSADALLRKVREVLGPDQGVGA